MNIDKSPRKFGVNVDSVSFSLSGMEFELPGADKVYLYDADRKLKGYYGNRVEVPGKYGSHKMQVRATKSGSLLNFNGTPYALRYGQNTFTANDLRRGCWIAISRTLKKLGIDAPEELVKKWEAGYVTVNHIDLAVNIALDSEYDVCRVIQQFKRQLVEQRCSASIYDTSVCWSPKEGKGFSITLYAKGPQMRRKFSSIRLPYKEGLLNESGRILRVEVRLQKSELKKHGLLKVKNWTEGVAESLFEKYFQKLEQFTFTSRALGNGEIAGLPQKLQRVLALNRAGIDWTQQVSARTVQRYNKEFRERGIDPRSVSNAEDKTLSLDDYLSLDKAYWGPPNWMIEAGIAPRALPFANGKKPSSSSIALQKQKRLMMRGLDSHGRPRRQF